jgi:signal peptidase I
MNIATTSMLSLKNHRFANSAGALLKILAVLLLVGAALWVFVARIYRIPQNGMAPALSQGSLLFARLSPYKSIAEVKRGDVVVFDQVFEGNVHKFMWRVVGLPGDRLQMDRHDLWLNGERVRHESILDDGEYIRYLETISQTPYIVLYERNTEHPRLPANIVVPAGHLFVLGDNRHQAIDSTYFGPIPFEAIVAKQLW